VAYSVVPLHGILHVVVTCKVVRQLSPCPTERSCSEGLVITCTVRADTLDPSEVLLLSGEFVNPGCLEVLAGLQHGSESSPSVREVRLRSGRAEPRTVVVGEEQVAIVVVANGEKIEGVVRHVGEKSAGV